MRSRHVTRSLLGAALMRALTACSGFLETENNDTPDVAATLATAAGIQTITATLYQAIWSSGNGATGAGIALPIYQQLANMAFESHTQINQTPGIRGILPRAAISNARGANGTADNFRDYSGLSKNSR